MVPRQFSRSFWSRDVWTCPRLATGNFPPGQGAAAPAADHGEPFPRESSKIRANELLKTGITTHDQALGDPLRMPNSARPKHRPKGWSPARRARQAALVRRWQPWRRSAGPQTEAGRARAAQNALKHGNRSRTHILQLQRVRHAIRLCAHTVAAVRAHMRGFPPPCPPKPEGRRGTPAPLRREATNPVISGPL